MPPIAIWSLAGPVACAFVVQTAFAQPVETARQAAARAFADGMAAFQAGKYLLAAERFEDANARQPSPEATYNAANAWQHAGVLDRAANDYAGYLRTAPPDARNRDVAAAALAELERALGSIHFDLHGVDHVTVDHAPVAGDSVFVNPGVHAVGGSAGGTDVAVTRSVGAGEKIVVSLEPPSPSSPTASTPLASSTPARAQEGVTRPPSGGWSPIVAYVGAGLTAIAAGATIWSGIDTSNARREFDAHPSPASLDDGRARESRTNVLFYTAVGLGTLTAAAAIWLVRWRGPSEDVSVGVSCASVRVRTTF